MIKYLYIDSANKIFQQFENYEISPCLIIGTTESGEVIYEACDFDHPEIAVWCVYGHFLSGGRECISDHNTIEDAENFERTLPVLGA